MQQLETIGRSLFGAQWQSELARALSVSDRSVRRWLAGDSAIPAGAWKDIHKLCLDRSRELAAMAKRIEKDLAE